MLLDLFLGTRVDTVAVIADCGEEHLAHLTASPAEDVGDVDGSNGVLLTKRSVYAPHAQASLGLHESLAMFHREVVEDVLGDDCLWMMEGAMQTLVEGASGFGLRRCRRELE